MFDLDETEHKFVLISGPQAGVYTYVCDGCCALLLMEQGEPSVFHGVCGSTLESCAAAREWQTFCPEDLPTLQQKMDAVRKDDFDQTTRAAQLRSEELLGREIRWRTCPLCKEELRYYGEPHSMCAVHEVLEEDQGQSE